jgi:hypothetical protein
MTGAVSLSGLAERLHMSLSWTRKNWRTLSGLPAPFIGGAPGEHPRWRPGDIDVWLNAPSAPVLSAPVRLPQPCGTPSPLRLAPANDRPAPAPAPLPDDDLAPLLRAAGIAC